MKELSKCCEKPGRTASGDEGTNWYVCSECLQPCDLKQEETAKYDASPTFAKTEVVEMSVIRARAHDWVKKMWKIGAITTEGAYGWTGEDEVEASINSYLEVNHLIK